MPAWTAKARPAAAAFADASYLIDSMRGETRHGIAIH
jgi:hypothetical protein